MIHQIRYREIDLLRGIAILMMVTNHFGYIFLSPVEQNSLFIAPLIFLGSFAPVVFYFVTGLGYGINYSKPIKRGYWFDVLFKALVLILVERATHLLDGKLVGMDFLSFIALILVILSIVRYYNFGFKTLLGIAAGLLGVRYFIGSVLLSEKEVSPVLAWLIGNTALKNFSYPITPWLVYPLLGYCLGKLIKQEKLSFLKLITSYKTEIMLSGLLIIILFFSIVWLKDDFVLNRWGRMSLDYFILSALLLLLLVVLSPSLADKSYSYLISIEGLTSLIVVPVHYFLLKVEQLNFSGGEFINIVNLIFILTASYVISILVSKLIRVISKLHNAFLILSLMVFVILVFLIFIIKPDRPGQLNILFFILQINLAAFFLVRPKLNLNNAK